MNAPSQPIVIQSGGPGFLVRAIWFIFIGWWLSGLAIAVGYFAALTIVGLPLAFYIFNRIPSITTLRPRTQGVAVETVDGQTIVRASTIAQRPIWVRAIYFVLVGWWLGAVWLGVAWICSVLIVTLPVALLMYNRIGAVMTLLRYSAARRPTRRASALFPYGAGFCALPVAVAATAVWMPAPAAAMVTAATASPYAFSTTKSPFESA